MRLFSMSVGRQNKVLLYRVKLFECMPNHNEDTVRWSTREEGNGLVIFWMAQRNNRCQFYSQGANLKVPSSS
uniref:SD01509p n=1 Tax=Drosophila melanogaster TaxID=7227 RepID=Q8T942_DROME|nr:SD01509p [Drosophila melanogaster]